MSTSGGRLRGVLEASLEVPALVWVTLLWQGVFLVLLGRSLNIDFEPGLRGVVMVAATFLSVGCLASSLGRATLGRPRTQWAILLALLAVLQGLFLSQCRLHAPLDFEFIAFNATNLGHPDTLGMLLNADLGLVALGKIEAVMLLASLALAGVLELLRIRLGGWLAIPAPAEARCAWAPFAVFVALLFTPWYSYEGLSYLLQTALVYGLPGSSAAFPPPIEAFPYLRAPAGGTGASRGAGGDRPNVFFLFVESFSSRFVEAKTATGAPVTPFFDRLLEQGVYLERFFSNATLTPRGQFDTLCSVLDGYGPAVFKQFSGNRYHCIQHVLQERGYRTHYFMAYKSLDFNDTRQFVGRQGFDLCQETAEDTLTPEELAHKSHWGIRDDHFYRRVFASLDREHDARPGPVFAALATAMSHYPFLGYPPEDRLLYSEPQTYRESFANAIRLADRCLETFFAELAARPWLSNSVVVVMGDHGFPVGEHGQVWGNEWYEEAFRTPLLILWKGHLGPRRIRDVAFCQLDVTPTVLGLMGIEEPNHFRGRDALAPASQHQTMIQSVNPLFGRSLVSMLYPLKFVRVLRTGREYLFDLQADPQETANLIDTHPDRPLVERLRRSMAELHLNQYLLRENRIWPAAPPGHPVAPP